MPSLQRIESQVAALPESELRRFRSWFDEFDAQRWDSAIYADINSGNLIHWRQKPVSTMALVNANRSDPSFLPTVLGMLLRIESTA